MKRCLVLFLTVLVLAFSACGNGNQAPSSGETGTVQSESTAPTATPTPDFVGTDFSGRWYVSEIIDSNGLPVSELDKQNLGAGFILELLTNSTYFVYGADSKVLGQGAYSVTLNQLTLTAQGSQTVYEIVDADTLRITQTDTSITVMKREAVVPLEEGDVIGGETTGAPVEGETGDDAEVEEETDIEEDPLPDSTPVSETSAPPTA